VELTVSDRVDPEAAILEDTMPLVVTARVDGRVAGFAEGWCRGDAARLVTLVVDDDHAHLDIGRHLVAAFRAEAATRGCASLAEPDVG
jgi:GNAT superfamily N-acetyltransferase